MSKRSARLQNWLELAQQANWSASEPAQGSGVSARVLKRYLLQRVGTSPKARLAKQRQELAIELIRDGYSVKEIAAPLNYRYSQYLSLDFKGFGERFPTQLLPSSFESSGSLIGNLTGFSCAFAIFAIVASKMADTIFLYLLMGSFVTLWLARRLTPPVKFKEIACASCGRRVTFFVPNAGTKSNVRIPV